MGLLRQLLGQQTDYVEAPAAANEQTHQTFTGSMMAGRGPSWGTRWDLTDGHLAGSPMNVTGAQRGLGALAHVAGVSGFGGVNALVNQAKPDPLAIPLSEIRSVSPGSEGGWLSPPTARIETTDGSFDLGVTGSLWALNRGSAAHEARDDFVEQLDRRLGNF
jgi:hypothetical protein